jgi:hypothetical protein
LFYVFLVVFIPFNYHLSILFFFLPRAGDDARSLRWVPLGDPPSLVFDHARIVADYRRYRDDPARYRRVGSGG